jgi:hypothetical protein
MYSLIFSMYEKRSRRFTAVGFTAVLGILLQTGVLFAMLMVISFMSQLYLESLLKYQIH